MSKSFWFSVFKSVLLKQNDDTLVILLKIANTVLMQPNNTKYRTLRKSNETVFQRILTPPGAQVYLKLMGFKEEEATFVLPMDASLEKLTVVRDYIVYLRQNATQATKRVKTGVFRRTNKAANMRTRKPIKRIVLPPFRPRFSVPFLQSVEKRFHAAQIYGNKDLQQRAKSLIPIIRLEQRAQMRLRAFQTQIKKEKSLAASGKSVALSEKSVALSEKNVALSEKSVALSEKSVALPEKSVDLSEKSVELSEKSVALSEKSVALSEKNMALSEKSEVSIQEMLILELLAWFKEEFFTWVDSPPCVKCNGKTEYSHMCTDRSKFVYTDRIEMHECYTCDHFTQFPRYDDLNILLETRRGRCGEWANTFTLFCYAMGWDARLIVDEEDHVWTEVFSFGQKRWLHCDPCENICDRPLIYENGWGAQLSYIMAYAIDDLQDVTWRYSSYHKAVLKRRHDCKEEDLVNAILTLREERYKSLSKSRAAYLTKRNLMELVELMVEKSPTDKDKQGRTSGSLDWRIARHEVYNIDQQCSFTWSVDDNTVNSVVLRYSASLDQYEFLTNSSLVKEAWHSGVFKQSNIFRKEETDWNNVYLCRTENTDVGNISWKISIQQTDKVIKKVNLKFDYTTFQSGKVVVKICNDETCCLLPTGETELETEDFSGSKSIEITATLNGGDGDVAWQHAQLFRQSRDSEDYPFELKILLR